MKRRSSEPKKRQPSELFTQRQRRLILIFFFSDPLLRRRFVKNIPVVQNIDWIKESESLTQHRGVLPWPPSWLWPLPFCVSSAPEVSRRAYA